MSDYDDWDLDDDTPPSEPQVKKTEPAKTVSETAPQAAPKSTPPKARPIETMTDIAARTGTDMFDKTKRLVGEGASAVAEVSKDALASGKEKVKNIKAAQAERRAQAPVRPAREPGEAKPAMIRKPVEKPATAPVAEQKPEPKPVAPKPVPVHEDEDFNVTAKPVEQGKMDSARVQNGMQEVDLANDLAEAGVEKAFILSSFGKIPRWFLMTAGLIVGGLGIYYAVSNDHHRKEAQAAVESRAATAPLPSTMPPVAAPTAQATTQPTAQPEATPKPDLPKPPDTAPVVPEAAADAKAKAEAAKAEPVKAEEKKDEKGAPPKLDLGDVKLPPPPPPDDVMTSSIAPASKTGIKPGVSNGAGNGVSGSGANVSSGHKATRSNSGPDGWDARRRQMEAYLRAQRH